jgi:hypothetical protein
MSIVQTTYPARHEAYVDGQLASKNTHDVDSFKATGGVDIPFGRAVMRSRAAAADFRDILLGVGRRQIATSNEALIVAEDALDYDGAVDVIRSNSYIVMGTEVMHVTAVTATVLTITRGAYGSVAATHLNNAPIYAFDRPLFLGVALMNEGLYPDRYSAGVGAYKDGDSVSVVWRGDIAVKVPATVKAGDLPVAATVASGAGTTAETVGQFSAKTPDATHVLIPAAHFTRDTGAQGISVIRFDAP